MSIDPNKSSASHYLLDVKESKSDIPAVESIATLQITQWADRSVTNLNQTDITPVFNKSISQCEVLQDKHGEVSKTSSSYQDNDISEVARKSGLESLQVSDNYTVGLSVNQIGSKALNLLYLQETLGGYAFVPEFLSLTHTEILDHILAYYPTFDDDWNQFRGLVHHASLSENSLHFLKNIQDRIQDLFTTHIFTTHGLEGFLLQFEENSLFMIRSSSMEDSHHFTNAGGNISIAGVRIDAKRISKAIGEVVGSYFSDRSMIQRSLAHDELAKLPVLSVFIQLMIGESLDNTDRLRIPVCGVAYTEEAFGRTEGIYQIQAGFGHNQGVVDSLLLVDTYYVYKNDLHHDVIRPKMKRVVVNTNGGYQMVENPTAIIEQSALSHELIVRLRKILSCIHTLYRYPVDIEWVYQPLQDRFYILQVRPLVHQNDCSSSYIDLERLKKSAAVEKVLQGEAVAINGGHCLVIQDPEEILYETTLERAFSYFSQRVRLGKKCPVKAVIINRHEVATSHYACVFREMGIPVFSCYEFDTFTFSNRENGHVLFLDSQTSKIVIARFEDIYIESRLPSIIREGWYRHPIHAVESIQHQEIVDNNVVDLLWQTFMHDDSEDDDMEETKSIKDLLLEISSYDTKFAKLAFKRFVRWLYRAINSFKDVHERKRGSAILKNVLLIGLEIDSYSHMQRMHVVKRIEAFLFQRSSSHIVKADSLLQLTLERSIIGEINLSLLPQLTDFERSKLQFIEKRAKKICSTHFMQLNPESQNPTHEGIKKVLIICQIAKKVILTPQTIQEWEQFFQKIISSNSKYAISILAEMISSVHTFQIFETWINNSFSLAYKNSSGDSIDILQKLYLELKSFRGVLERIRNGYQSLNELHEQEDRWAYPEFFESLFNHCKQNVLSEVYKLQEEYFAFEESQSLVKTALMQYFHAVLDGYDRAIKIMKSSPLYENRLLQVSRFREMLIVYQSLVNHWLKKIPLDFVKDWTRGIHETLWSGDYRDYIQCAIDRMNEKLYTNESLSELELYPTPNFNVAATVVNSGRADSQFKLFDCTLEDLFTLMHQNVLAAFMATHTEDWEKVLPTELKRLHEMIISIQDAIQYMDDILEIKANLLTMRHIYPCLISKYNIPIKNHSAIIDIAYHIPLKRAEIDVKIIGHNMGDRMSQVAQKIFIRAVANTLIFVEMPEYDEIKRSLGFKIQCSQQQLQSPYILNNMKEIILEAIHDTLTGVWGVIETHDLKQLDHGNLDVWDPVISNTKIANYLLQKGGYNYIDKLVHRLITYKRQDLLCNLFRQYKVEIPATTEPLEERIIRGCMNGVQKGRFRATFTSEGALPFSGVSSFDKYIEAYLRKNTKSLLIAFEEREKTIYSNKESLEHKLFSINLHLWIFSMFITGKNIIESESTLIKTFIDFLSHNNLNESLALIYSIHCHPNSLRAPLIISSLIAQYLEGQFLNEQVIHPQFHNIIDVSNLKEGDYIFIQTIDNSIQFVRLHQVINNSIEFVIRGNRHILCNARIKSVFQ